MMVLSACAIDEMSLCSAITDTYDYDAFGNKINSTGSTPNNFLYRGEEFDSDLGLYYLRARYYNPLTGRFLSRDPENGKVKDPASLHKYLYAGGDPVNWRDPSGRAELKEVVGFAVTAWIIGKTLYINYQCITTIAAAIKSGLEEAASSHKVVTDVPQSVDTSCGKRMLLDLGWPFPGHAPWD